MNACTEWLPAVISGEKWNRGESEGHMYHFYFINFLMFKLVITSLYHFCTFKRLKAAETLR